LELLSFLYQHANLESWQPVPFNPENLSEPIDKWLFSRLNHTIEIVTANLEKYNTAKSTAAIEKLVSDLSTWYIRRSRNRVDNFPLLQFVFDNIFRLMSPFTPFLSEILYQNLHQKSSVHLENWPESQKDYINEKLESDMELVRNLCQQAHFERQKACIKIRQPLSSLSICCPVVISEAYLNNLSEIMAEEVNVKKVTISQESKTKVTLDTNITPELSSEGEYRDFVRNIQVLRKNQGFEVKDRIKIIAPSWPKEYESQILAKTLADSIETGNELKLEKI